MYNLLYMILWFFYFYLQMSRNKNSAIKILEYLNRNAANYFSCKNSCTRINTVSCKTANLPNVHIPATMSAERLIPLKLMGVGAGIFRYLHFDLYCRSLVMTGRTDSAELGIVNIVICHEFCHFLKSWIVIIITKLKVKPLLFNTFTKIHFWGWTVHLWK